MAYGTGESSSSRGESIKSSTKASQRNTPKYEEDEYLPF